MSWMIIMTYLKNFSRKEDHFFRNKDIAPEFTTIQMSYDVKDFCDNTNIYNYFSAKIQLILLMFLLENF